MFTGIIKEVGKVKKIKKSSSLIELGISSDLIYSQVSPQDSISVNGVCLTLVKKEKKILFFEAVKSTLQVSNLKRLKINDFVNLEPAISPQDKLSGHFVLGHIDSEVSLRRITSFGNWWQIEVEVPSKFKKFILENGCVALEGISLTVKKVYSTYFTVDIVPFTYKNTNLQYKKIGDKLNIEYDYLIKIIKQVKNGA